MNQVQTSPYSFTPVDANIDWITATAKAGSSGRSFRQVGAGIIDAERVAGREVKPATLRDYVGWRGDGIFVGKRASDALIITSGRHAPPHWESIAQHADNVSRLDLQVTLWTHGETPPLAREEWEHLRNLPPSRGRPRSLTLIQSHPHGETLNVGKRQSDAYGRVYDWATAHKAGAAATIWRYEVELKRLYAWRHSRALLGTTDRGRSIRDTVHAWFRVRGLRMPWSTMDSELSVQLGVLEMHRDPLAWLETSVSKTIAKAVRRHGIERVLLALGLSDTVRPVGGRRKSVATDTPRAVPSNPRRRAARPVDTDGLSLQDERELRADLIPHRTARDDG